MMNFSSHGIRRAFFPIGSDPTWISKTFKFVWILAWLAAGSYMIKQMTETVSSYLKKEVITTSSTRRGEPVEFPALTICTKKAIFRGKSVKMDGNMHKFYQRRPFENL